MLIELSEKIGQLQGETKKGFEGVNQRLDRLNGNVHNHCERIQKLEGFKNNLTGKISILVIVLTLIISFILNKI